MHFYSRKEKWFIVNNRGWRRIYRLATMFDWKPEGTRPPESWENPQEWDPMNYFSNDGQIVNSLDANLLAESIYEAIDYLEEEESDTSIEEVYGKDWEDEMVCRWKAALVYGLKDPAFIFFDLHFEEKLLDLVHFCRAGEFMIF
jgi:hypothetical protein